MYVKSADECEPVKDFLTINLINVITPNGDGHNDYLDYRSTGKNYKWDGKAGNRNLPTGTDWYVIKWTKPDIKLPVSFSG